MVVHAFNPSIPEAGKADLSEFKTILAPKTIKQASKQANKKPTTYWYNQKEITL